MEAKAMIGLSLPELLIACSLNIALIGLCSAAYLIIKQRTSAQNIAMRWQYESNFASYYLTRSIREACYAGCSRLEYLEANNGVTGSFSSDSCIMALAAGHLPGVKFGTDVLAIQKLGKPFSMLASDARSKTHELRTKSDLSHLQDRYLAISDCTHLDIFKAKYAYKNFIISDIPIQHAYRAQDSQISGFDTILFFIGFNPSDRSYSLYAKNGDSMREILLHNVSAMKVTYALNERPIKFYTGQEIARLALWRRIALIKIALTTDIPYSILKAKDLYIHLRLRS